MKTMYTNGNIYTMEKQQPKVEAVLTENDKILAAGKRKDLQTQAERIVDLEGKTLLPAFVDSHSHLAGVANGLLQVDLSEVVCFAEVKQKILDFIKMSGLEKGKWILVKGINHGNLKEKQLPTKSFLDEITTEYPLVVQHTSGHSGVWNSAGLEELGITAQTQYPSGGRINFETGILEEAAFIEMIQKVPMPSLQALSDAFVQAQRLYASYGISTIQEGMFMAPLQGIYQMLYAEKKLFLDVVGYVDLLHDPALIDAFPKCKNQYNNHLKIGGYKVILDGSPQSKTAWTTKHYDDGTNGFGLLDDDKLFDLVAYAVKQKQQLLMHANGDAAIDQYLRVYAAVKEQFGDAVRPVLIHGQMARIDQLQMMKQLGVTPSFFAAHVYHWGDLHYEQMGAQRASQISPLHSAMLYDIPFTLHQDAPVIPPNMMETVWCAVTRKTKQGKILGGFEKITPYDAIFALTYQSANQYGEENQKGSIKAGKQADFVILDKDPMQIEPEGLRDVGVFATIKNGNTIYQIL